MGVDMAGIEQELFLGLRLNPHLIEYIAVTGNLVHQVEELLQIEKNFLIQLVMLE
jgi:hypothetical protein